MMQNSNTLNSGSDNRWYALLVFFLVSVFNYLDRTVLSILQVPVKQELGMSDAQMGMLTGLAFALFYTTFSLPIARLADRTVRKVVIAVSLVVWSVMTALMGLATGFAVLALLRIGVAIGEAGSVPAVHSMISDYFPPGRRATALSLLGLSLPAGMMFGFLLGGWLVEGVGWRAAFAYIGVAGVFLVPLLLFTVREPQRGRYDLAPPNLPSVGRAMRLLWSLRSFRLLAMAGGFNAYAQHAMLAWNAPFYSRVFELPLARIGMYLALMYGVGGAIGVYCGGFFADYIGGRNPRGYLMVPGFGVLAVAPFGLVQYLTTNLYLSITCGVITSALVVFYFAPIVSAAHMLVLPRMRALTSAMLVLIVNLVGVGLGPLVTGAISDLLIRSYGLAAASLRYAIASAMFVAVISAMLWWRASLHFVRERNNVIEQNEAIEPNYAAMAPPKTSTI
jgi:predicted MFS family arabinose efflux permease